MGGGVLGGVEDLTGSRGAPVEFHPIPGGYSLLPKIRKIRRGRILGDAKGGDENRRSEGKADPFHTPIIGEKKKYSLDISCSLEYVLLQRNVSI
jgi:hypothetical protein